MKAIAGMLATARIPAATGTPALSKGCHQENAQPQQQRCQKQQDLCGKAKVAGNEDRNMAVNVALIKKNLVVVKGLQVAAFFARSGSEGLQGSGKLRPMYGTIAIWKVYKIGLQHINTVSCIQYTYSHRDGKGGELTREKVRGVTVHKAGSKIQHD
jgi:hypothetical protein